MQEKIRKRVLEKLGSCEIKISMEDGLDGTYAAIEVQSEKFRDISRIEQHRMVLKALEDLIATNEIHAVKIKTRV